MDELKMLGVVALAVVVAALLKTIAWPYVIGLFATGTASSTAQGIAVFIAAIVVSFAVWAIIGKLTR
jgi:hypothetical protein